MREYISTLTSLRRTHPALRYGDYMTIRADEQIYAYLRSDFNERILVVIHRGESPKQITIELPEILKIRDMECLNGSPEIRQNTHDPDLYHIRVQPYSGYIFAVDHTS
ncbi:MAG: alpha-glucosidase C-terminal domain-containing protein [Candidatus Marinimicrobia bacterium]|nr:alpha-glucosidase C-terminal domain-containing protein [Candidatus Neomarinimicrobiota bacterium]